MFGPYAQEFLAIAGFHLLAVASPGPDFALILAQSIRRGRRVATWSAIGIGTGILIHVAYTVVGLAVVLREAPQVFRVMQYLCAAYLAWLGWRALRSRPRSGSDATAAGEGDAPSQTDPADVAPSDAAAFTTGFFTNALNPKATLFFVSVFSVMVRPSTPAWIQTGYGLWMAVTTAVWFTVVGWFFTQPRVRGWFLRCGHWFDRITGAVLIALALRLAFTELRPPPPPALDSPPAGEGRP